MFTAHMDGQTLDQVMAATDCSRGSVSSYLNEMERETWCQIVHGNCRALKTAGFQAERENGKRRVSVWDFHSFRLTWITLALAVGVPLELDQRVTGHGTAAGCDEALLPAGRGEFRSGYLQGDAENAGGWGARVGEVPNAGDYRKRRARGNATRQGY